jgi:TPP-dependent 2-oxoacid decarboxylase
MESVRGCDKQFEQKLIKHTLKQNRYKKIQLELHQSITCSSSLINSLILESNK